MSETMIEWNQGAKDAVDPNNVFGAGNLCSLRVDKSRPELKGIEGGST
jgi:hypothetical protein